MKHTLRSGNTYSTYNEQNKYITDDCDIQGGLTKYNFKDKLKSSQDDKIYFGNDDEEDLHLLSKASKYDYMDEYSMKDDIDDTLIDKDVIIDDDDDIEKEIKENLTKPESMVCKSCNSDEFLFIDHHKSNLLCTKCGIVNDRMILSNCDSITNMNNDKVNGVVKNRFGGIINPYLPQSSLSTSMVLLRGTKRSSYLANIMKVQRWDNMPYNEKRLWRNLNDIEKRCIMNDIPRSVINEAFHLYKMIDDSKYKTGKRKGKKIIKRGNVSTSLKIAAVSMALNNNCMGKTDAELAKIFGLEKVSYVSSGCKLFKKLLGKKINKKINTMYDYKGRCKILRFSEMLCDIVGLSIRNIMDKNIASEKKHMSTIAGCIKLIVNEFRLFNISTTDISKACDTTCETTINDTFCILHQYRKDILPKKEQIVEIIKKHKGKKLFLVKPKKFSMDYF